MATSHEIYIGYNNLYKQIYNMNSNDDIAKSEERIQKFIEETGIAPVKLFKVIVYYMKEFDSKDWGKSIFDLLSNDPNKKFIWNKCLEGATQVNSTVPVTHGNHISSGWYWRQQDQSTYRNVNKAMKWMIKNNLEKELGDIICRDRLCRAFEEDVPCMHRLLPGSEYPWNNGDCEELQRHLIREHGFSRIPGEPFQVQPPIIETKALEQIIQEATT